jgi:hypothetical protein
MRADRVRDPAHPDQQHVREIGQCTNEVGPFRLMASTGDGWRTEPGM